MNRYPIYCPKDLKRVQTRIYNSLDTKTPHIVSGTHYCSNEERYKYLSEEDPNTIIIETNTGMLEELNIALYMWYMHYRGDYTISSNVCPACEESTF